MKFHYTNLETCHTATGLVVVIDVICAFTNAAVAFPEPLDQPDLSAFGVLPRCGPES